MAESVFFLNASGPLPVDRDQLGRAVREQWVRWAQSQPAPKSSWLVAYDDLPEVDREADRQIGEHVCRLTMLAIAAANGSPANDNYIATVNHLHAIRCRLRGVISSCRNDAMKSDLLKILGEDS